MTHLDTLVLLLVLALAVLGALRLDLLGLLWREWLKLGNAVEPPPPGPEGHGPYQLARSRPTGHGAQPHRPEYHRSGRRG